MPKSPALDRSLGSRLSLDAYRREDPSFTPIFVKYFGTNPPSGEIPAGRNKIAPINTNPANSQMPLSTQEN